MLVFNLALAIVWMVLQKSFTLVDFTVGMLVGFGVIALTEPALEWQSPGRRRDGRAGYARFTWRVISFAGFALWAIVRSNLEVARIVLSPRHVFRPGIVAIPLDVQSDMGITLLANLITITPGTVTLDVASDRRTLYIHVMDVRDPAALRDEIKDQFERRVMELFP